MNKSSSNATEADPLLDEIRAIRKAVSEQFENDVDRLCDHLQLREKEHPDRIISQNKAAQTVI